ncbi:MAG TPA: preprotein translocase subunit SecG [Steroidobacteraceae bacterium]
MLRIALTFIQFFSALAIVGLVMLQRGKGAEAGAGFGAGASGTVFGARGAGTALSRATAIFTAVFMLNSLALGYVGAHRTEQPKSIFDTAGQTQQLPARGAPPVSLGKAAPGNGSPAAGASGATQRGSSAPAGGAAPPAPATGTVPSPAPPAGK